ncbi:MAG: hypothetical protein GY910_00220 [bacterium]|nr:hypothetical protein [Deltaproteobacteria bacterium]MCP4903381.1 hypothetical protein [bacterium]
MKPSSVVPLLVVALVALAVGHWSGRIASKDGIPEVAGDNAETQLVAILRGPDPGLRMRQLFAFFEHADPAQADELRAVFVREHHDVDQIAKVIFAAWWAGSDPTAAMDNPLPPNWGGDDAWSRVVIRKWAQRDPQAALAHALEMSGKPEAVQFETYRALIQGWFDRSDTDPDDLLPVFERFLLLRPRGELIKIWVNLMLRTRGVDYSIAYAEAMPENDETLVVKQQLMGRLASRLVGEDFDKALAFANRNAATKAGDKLGWYFVTAWAQIDGPAAVEWALQVPKTRISFKIVERAFVKFQATDRASAHVWMAAQPFSEKLEPAYAIYVSSVAAEDHQRAIVLSEKFVSERHRYRAYQAIGRSWIDDDREAAEAWVRSLDLPDDLVKRILGKGRGATIQ